MLLPLIVLSGVVAAAGRKRMRPVRRDDVIGLEVVGRDTLSVGLGCSGGSWVEEVVHRLEGAAALAAYLAASFVETVLELDV